MAHASMSQEIKNYWEKSTPMNFGVEKWTYEQKRGFRYTLQDYMGRDFNFAAWKGKSVLELGCGSGIDSCEFARWGANVSAVDITDNAVNLTKDLAAEAKVAVNVQKYDGYLLPFGREAFDCVYSYGVLHHVPSVETVLSDAWRVLKWNGKMMAMLYHKDSLLMAYSILYLHGIQGKKKAEINVDELTSMYSERNEGCPYTKAYTKQEAKELFGQFFSNVTVDVRYNVLDLTAQRKVKFNLDDKYELGWHLVVKGTK